MLPIEDRGVWFVFNGEEMNLLYKEDDEKQSSF